MNNQRIPYYDIAKGLLIIFVAWGHSDNNIVANGFDINRFEAIHDVCFLPLFSTILAFYMPAFFFITGCCTNFEKGVKEFMVSRLKTLLFPMFVFCYLPFLAVYMVKGSDKFMPMFIEFLSGGKWFISALFFSEIFFYCINRYVTKDRYKQLVVCVLMYVTGSLIHCSGMVDSRHDFWALTHALQLTFMLPLGAILKEKIGKCSLLASFVCFTIACVITKYTIGFFPYITNFVDMNYASILPLFVLAISGAVFIVSLCKAIGRMPVLEFLGRHSLIIYFLHGHFYFYNLILPRIEDKSYTVMLVFWIISIITAVVIPACISKAMDVKYCRIFKGKF